MVDTCKSYLSHVKEPVHVPENVMYSQIPWKIGCRLGVVFQPSRTSPDVLFQAERDFSGMFLSPENF